MSRCLRYQNPVICDYLASKYVAGTLTSRVRRRIEALLITTPELDRAIARWADSFAELHIRLPEPEISMAAQQASWTVIEQAIHTETAEEKKAKVSFWNSLFVWRFTTGGAALASVLMAYMLFTGSPVEPTVVIAGPDYLANMSAQGDSPDNVRFVITAYKKTEQNERSRLHVQWLKGATRSTDKRLHLWAEDKDTKAMTYIGLLPDNTNDWSLTKSAWKAVTTSQRLLMTADNHPPSASNTLFSGLCLQLNAWKENT
ncbi:hypothetical protein [Amphritea sp.]|uniref:hypothetical protein n=1 Tax=Amphritea sp. TaxID=1872502 RepID=UPI003D0C1B29